MSQDWLSFKVNFELNLGEDFGWNFRDLEDLYLIRKNKI